MWYRVGVATGSNTVTATMSESMSKATIIALSYCGVHQSTPIGTPATADTPNPTLSSVSVSSDGTELVVDAVMTAGAALTADGSQTVRITETSFASYYNLASSDKIGSGTTTMAWTLDVNDSNGIIAVPLKAVAAAPSTSPRRMVVVVQ
jgi:hypothetical protein